MPTAKKTEIQMLNDSYERANTLNAYSCEFSEDSYMIINNVSGGEYIITIDHDRMKVVDCTCKHRQYRLLNLNLPCKHMIYIAQQLNYDC